MSSYRRPKCPKDSNIIENLSIGMYRQCDHTSSRSLSNIYVELLWERWLQIIIIIIFIIISIIITIIKSIIIIIITMVITSPSPPPVLTSSSSSELAKYQHLLTISISRQQVTSIKVSIISSEDASVNTLLTVKHVYEMTMYQIQAVD